MKVFIDAFDEKGVKQWTRELRDCRITADENAKNHASLPRLASVGGGSQKPLDFAPWATPSDYHENWTYKLRASANVSIIQQAKNEGNYVAVVSIGENRPQYWILVHVEDHNFKPGTIIKAGQYICRIAKKSENGGYAAHIHVDAHNKAGVNTRDLVFYKVPVDDWITRLVGIGQIEVQANKDTALYDIDTMKVVENYPKGKIISVRFSLDKKWYLTRYLFVNKIKQGFLISDWGLYTPAPIPSLPTIDPNELARYRKIDELIKKHPWLQTLLDTLSQIV